MSETNFCSSIRALTKPMVLTVGSVVATLTSAQAQRGTDCIAPHAPQLMIACAAKEYTQTDEALNAAWKHEKSFANAVGKGNALLGSGPTNLLDAVRTA